MTTITIPHPDPSYDERHGIARWSLTLSDAHYVWEKAGYDLRGFEGRKSGDCADDVAELITCILADPDLFLGVRYYDLVGTTEALTRLFFMLRTRRDGIVHVE